MFPFRAPPTPLYQNSLIKTHAAIVILLSLCVATASAGSITRPQCDANLDELLSEIESNRITTIAEINKQLADKNNPANPEALEIMREQTWDQEEQQRGQASYMWRDCMQAVNKRNP